MYADPWDIVFVTLQLFFLIFENDNSAILDKNPNEVFNFFYKFVHLLNSEVKNPV